MPFMKTAARIGRVNILRGGRGIVEPSTSRCDRGTGLGLSRITMSSKREGNRGAAGMLGADVLQALEGALSQRSGTHRATFGYPRAEHGRASG